MRSRKANLVDRVATWIGKVASPTSLLFMTMLLLATSQATRMSLAGPGHEVTPTAISTTTIQRNDSSQLLAHSLSAVRSGCSESDINVYLTSKASPLAGTGNTHVSAGQYYNVDPRLVVAIAGAESTFGRNGSCALYRHNAWGYGGGWPNCWNFDSWDKGILKVTWQLWDYIYQRGLTNIHAIGQLWCGSGCTHWESNVRTFYAEQGGNPDTNDLSYTGACGDCPLFDKGDANCDGCVDDLDYVHWWASYKKNLEADFNSDGITDDLDYVIWWKYYGTGCE